MSDGLRVFEAGEGRPLDIAGIQADLAVLWKEASSAGKEPAMRASRVNLVAVLRGEDPRTSGQALFEEMLPIIVRTYPARVLAVHTERGGQAGSLTASVSALCSLGGGARYVCCERITLAAGTGAEPSLPGTILSLLLAELPVVVWVPSDLPIEAPWLKALLGFADRLLIDSAIFPAPAAAFSALERLTDAFKKVDLADFEWLRLAGHRRAIGASFEAPEARAAAAAGFERVTFFEQGSGRTGGGTGSGTSAGSRAGGTRAAAAHEDGARAGGKADASSGSPGMPSRAPSKGRESALGDASPAGNTASAASLLIRAWILRRAEARSFVWAPPPDGAASDSALTVRFEGRTAGSPFCIDVPAPHAEPAPTLSDFAQLIGGQSDHPFTSARAGEVGRGQVAETIRKLNELRSRT